ncbi:MAG: ParA family protein [Chloroflexi bacterium]|nr:ParA family protein [Chloroflexota bacterium]
MSHVIAIVNQKGGVGKTTTAVNLGAGLARLGHRCLVVDCDPQSNATRSLGILQSVERTIYDVLVDNDGLPIREVILPSNTEGLAVLPASPSLSGAEVELVNMWGRESRLKHALEPVREDYDFVLLDCPPSLGLISVNALVAADGIIVPVQCEYLSLEGLGLLTRTLELVKSRLNAQLELVGLVMTMYDARTRLAAEVVSEVQRHFPELQFATVIPRSIRLGEAPSYGETIFQYAPDTPGALAYSALAEELVARMALDALATG